MDNEFLLTHYEQIHEAYSEMESMFKQFGNDELGHSYRLKVDEEIPSSVNKEGYKVVPKVVIYEDDRLSMESAFTSLSCAYNNLRAEILHKLEY